MRGAILGGSLTRERWGSNCSQFKSQCCRLSIYAASAIIQGVMVFYGRFLYTPLGGHAICFQGARARKGDDYADDNGSGNAPGPVAGLCHQAAQRLCDAL